MGRLFDRVLVAYDGSEAARDALALGLRLLDHGGSIVLACVVEQRGWHLPGHIRAAERAMADAEEMLIEARASVPARIRVRLRTPVASSAARGLTELAEREDADVIAIGSAHGDASGDRIGLARTAGRLLQGGPCAVVVAPPGLCETGPFHHVGVAFDGSPESAAALAAACVIAGAARSAMTLYSVLDPYDEHDQHARLAVSERLDAAANGAPHDLNPRTELLRGAPAIAIADACDGVVDLLVCGSRGYGPVQRALLGSVSEELIARSRQPVLVVPRPAATPATAAA